MDKVWIIKKIPKKGGRSDLLIENKTLAYIDKTYVKWTDVENDAYQIMDKTHLAESLAELKMRGTKVIAKIKKN